MSDTVGISTSGKVVVVDVEEVLDVEDVELVPRPLRGVVVVLTLGISD